MDVRLQAVQAEQERVGPGSHIMSGTRSALEFHWRPAAALEWALLLLLCTCNTRSESSNRTNSSSQVITSTVLHRTSSTLFSVTSTSQSITTPFPSPTRPPYTTTTTSSAPTTPTPPPKYNEPIVFADLSHLLYVRIEDISVTFRGTGDSGYHFPPVNGSMLEKLGHLPKEIHNSANEIVFTEWYGSSTQNFSLKFDFSTNTSDEGTKWYVRSITHSNPNVTSERKVLFVYQSVQYNVKAPLGYVYSCDRVRAVGYDLADPDVLPTLELRNITIQAFMTDKLSEKTISCGDKNENNNEQIGLIIGLVIGITVILAIIVIATSTFIMKWKKKTDYDLLD